MLATMLALISISLYFILNLLVTVTNRIIVTQTSSPYLLTACHAFASSVSTTILTRFQIMHSPSTHRTSRASIKLLLFSVLFTINISLSNYTLGLVSLPVHQTIRATAPALTIAFSIFFSLRTWSSYNLTTYFSLIPIVLGVILTTNGGRYDASVFGFVMTFASAVTAVLKTIATHSLQTHLDMKASELIHQTAPLALVQSLGMAWYYEEFTNFMHLPRPKSLALGEPRTWLALSSLFGLMLMNALLAAMLNLSSFEANRRCGPVSMGVAANLKQVAILLIPFLVRRGGRKPGLNVFVGGMMTVTGGAWYALAQGRIVLVVRPKVWRIDTVGEGDRAGKEQVV